MKSIYENIYDIVIVGGGIGGATSAVSAAREGAKVLLIEKCGYLGGALTSCGVGPMMSFHAGGKQVILGLGEEIIERLKKIGGTPGHIPDAKLYCETVTPFNSEKLKLVLEQMLLEAGCDILYHTSIGDVITENGKIISLLACNKDGINKISGKVFIDASGDGDIAHWSGAKTIFGREDEEIAQPMTMNMKYCGVDRQKLYDFIVENNDRYPMLTDGRNPFAPKIPLDVMGFKPEFKEARDKGELSFERGNVLMFETDRPGEFILNTTRVLNHKSTDAVSLSDAEIIGRKQCYELDLFMKKYAPGFENATLEITGPSIGVRSSRQLVGRYVLTADDLLDKVDFEDKIAHSGYPIDIHNPSGAGGDDRFITGENPYYCIPYRVMVCDEISNLIVTGRCISTTFEAQSAVRTTPTISAMGHASGIAAAMAVKDENDTRTIDIKVLQKRLVETGAYLEI